MFAGFEARSAPITHPLGHMSSKPTNVEEFSKLACKLADTGRFANALTVRAALGYWPDTLHWWTDGLEWLVEGRCRRAEMADSLTGANLGAAEDALLSARPG
ncbi:hypothetical protein [Terricaulis sp.]|uniref:hypothetical protein n=1 Tax=Terricaulis sp. TaxID=2768686 RepID=UPI002ADE0F70|nr:hypothetical protein [Terricaulis sp.]